MTQATRGGRVRLAGRGRTWSVLVATVAGMLVAGLSVPYLFGEKTSSVASGGGLRGPTVDEAPSTTSEGPVVGGGEAAGAPLPASPRTATGGPATDGAVAKPVGPRAPSSGAGQMAKLAATDVGVTADSVKLGMLLLDLGGASRVGFASGGLANADDQRKILQAYVDEWNDTGGINGRKIVPAFAKFDPLSDASKQAACLALTEDAQVFAVLDPSSGYNGASVLCFTETHRTVLLSGNGFNNISDEVQRRSGGRLFGLSMRGIRILQNAVTAWDQLGLLTGRTIGILDSAELGNPQTVDAGLISTLSQRGYRVKERVIFSTDMGTASSQVPTAVQQMRNAGVDLVVNATNGLYTAQFSQAADAQGYRPRYVASDWALNGTDFTAQNNSAGYDGTTVITVFRGNDIGRIPISGPERRCESIYSRRIGPPPPRDPSNPNAWVGFVVRCAVLDYTVRGLRAAGAGLTRVGLPSAFPTLGTLEPALFLPGTFRSGKPDLADNYYVEQWKSDCRCHRVVGGPHPASFA